MPPCKGFNVPAGVKRGITAVGAGRHPKVERGFSLLEIIIVVAILGVLFALMLNFNPQDRLQVQQAAKSFVVSVQKARFEAISKNLFAGVRVTDSSFQIFLDTDPAGAPDRAYSAGDQIVEEVAIGSGSYPLVRLTSDAGRDVVFTPRGTPYGLINETFNFSSTRRGYVLKAKVTLQGRVRLAQE